MQMNGIYLTAKLNEDSSEEVDYDLSGVPIYMRRGRLSYYENYTFVTHWHTDFEFIAALEGSLKYNINGKTVTVDEGDGIFINSGNMHFGYSDTGEDCTFLCLLVHPTLFCQNPYIERSFISPIVNDTNHPYLILRRSDPDSADIIKNIGDIFALKGTADYYLKIQGRLFDIVSGIYSLTAKCVAEPVPRRGFEKMKLMLDYISVRYAEKLTLKDIADSAGISKSLCSALFRQFLHCSPFEYLIKYRIEKASQLLRSTALSVTEIAFSVGFSGSSYFAETFRNITGMTPKEYRRVKSNEASGE